MSFYNRRSFFLEHQFRKQLISSDLIRNRSERTMLTHQSISAHTSAISARIVARAAVTPAAAVDEEKADAAAE